MFTQAPNWWIELNWERKRTESHAYLQTVSKKLEKYKICEVARQNGEGRWGGGAMETDLCLNAVVGFSWRFALRYFNSWPWFYSQWRPLSHWRGCTMRWIKYVLRIRQFRCHFAPFMYSGDTDLWKFQFALGNAQSKIRTDQTDRMRR